MTRPITLVPPANLPRRRTKTLLESHLSLSCMHWDPEPVRIPLSLLSATLSPAQSGGEGRERGRFMESRSSFFRTDCDSEPTPNPSQEGNRNSSVERLLPSWAGPGVGCFMECRLGLATVHWDPEPLAVPRRRKSADKSDALQTL